MRPRNLLLLALVVVGLAAFIWFVERDVPSTDERKARAQLALGVEADEILAVVVERPGEPELRLERQPAAAGGERPDDPFALAEGSWTLSGRFSGPADASAADGLASSLATLERERALDEVDPEALGLAEPRLRFTVVTEKGEQTWRVGSEIPASSNMIVQREGAGEALVVADFVYSELAKPAGEWRSRDLFPGDRDEVRRVVLSGGDEARVLAKRADGFWLEAPLVDRADAEAVEELLSDLAGLEAEEFVDEPAAAAELGLEPPAGVVEVALGEAEEVFRLEIGGVAATGEDEEEAAGAQAPRYARVGDQVVRIGGALGAALERSPAEWQATEWSTLDSWQVDRAVFRDAAGELELVREAGEWLRGGETLPYDPVSDLLYAVDSAAGERLVPAAALATGEAELEIVLEGDGRGETLRLFPSTGEGFPAAAEGREWLLLLSAGTADDLKLKVAEVRAAEPESDEESPEELPADEAPPPLDEVDPGG